MNSVRSFHTFFLNASELIKFLKFEGKGTNFEDGLSIFSAYINHIIDENPKSHFIFSTHIHSLPEYLERSSHLNYQQMEIKFEDNEIFYTYKLIDGFAEFSFPLELGKNVTEQNVYYED